MTISRDGAVTGLTRRIVTTFYRRMVVVTKDVDTNAIQVLPAIPSEIRVLDESEVGAYHAFKPFQHRTEVETRLSRGHRCFAIWHEGRIVHAGWAATGRAHIPYLHSDILLGPKDFYIYDSYTDPSFRRAKLVIARSSAMHVHFGGKGFLRSYGVIALMNRAGLAVVEPSGYRRIGMYGCLRLGLTTVAWAYPDPAEPLPRLVKTTSRQPVSGT
jgi:hypothetical protein